jgi:O-acetylhomoserine (thiol)-lyase
MNQNISQCPAQRKEENTMNKYSIGTECLHAGYVPGNGQPRNIPIIQSTTFRYKTSAQMGALFDLEAEGYFYTRLQNPTSDQVAAKIADAGGRDGRHAYLLRQAASFLSVFNICSQGIMSWRRPTSSGTFNLLPSP